MRRGDSCEWVERHAAAYLDEALPADQHRRLDLHLMRCDGCRSEVEGLRWTIERLASLPRAAMPVRSKRRLIAAARTPSTAA